MVGMLQANEAIKLITGLGEILASGLLIVDALLANMRRLTLYPAPRVGHPDRHEVTFWLHPVPKAIKLFRSDIAPVLIDVRETSEREDRVLNSFHIPLGSLPSPFDELPVDRDLILYCKSGIRSARGALYLASQRRFGWIYSLKGGITAPVQTLFEKYYANGGH